ncbi:hypothetical protein TRFO_40321 [Tritrichomonas foetus]|uniref:Inner centromere protein ARK-binding domain-containing protein n=1 Tax=Tritrichomonas foetus TaxID=1144522 RepID=A0A1J4J3Q6_9EUKA|nr:hypothetical protein TRFO_40321 [Tritrichomonas foetus]|eukprot:OHS93377.1 hypothetical protein TRFO_40321 [Tritrichomonas foetus]
MSKGDANLEQEFEKHLNWMQSLIADNDATTASQSSGKNDYESQIDDLIASIQSPSEQKQPKVSDICQTYSNLNQEAQNSKPQQSKKSEVKQYRISDIPEDSEEESDCEDYYVEDAAEIRGQEIPDWARAANLLVELQKQASVDPDKIFTNFERTCDLSSMFEKKKRSFKVRGDSGWWAADGLTPAEEANYKKAVGFA